jgi:hypothetical protein
MRKLISAVRQHSQEWLCYPAAGESEKSAGRSGRDRDAQARVPVLLGGRQYG